VINFDLPNNIDSYVHRIGRTGRCGNEGNTIAFVNENNKPIFKDLLKLLKETKQDIPQWFADMVYQSYPKNTHFNPYNKKRTQHNFGGRDYRTQKHFDNNYSARNNDNMNSINNGDKNINNFNDNTVNNTIPNISYRRDFVQMTNGSTSFPTVNTESTQNDSW